jgi:transposase
MNLELIKKYEDRDINAAKNILAEAKNIAII